MVDDGSWPGESLIVIGDTCTRPTAAELAQNYCFIKPLVMKNPSKAMF